MADDLENLRKLREIPDELSWIGQQTLLNLVCGSIDEEVNNVEIWVKINGHMVDYAKAIRESHERINGEFDKLMVKLGFPEGTGRFVS